MSIMGLEENELLKEPAPPELEPELYKGSFDESIEWFTKSPEFNAWRDDAGFSLLWIHGPPACGKTTLLAYTLRRLPQYIKYTNNWDVAAIFRGRVTHSVNELLASLAFQLINNSPRTEIPRKEVKSQLTLLTGREFTNYLRDLLKIAVTGKNIHETIFLIDGLDQYEAGIRSAFLSHLLALGKQAKQNISIRILISSRPYPDIQEALSHYPNIEPDKERRSEMLRAWNM